MIVLFERSTLVLPRRLSGSLPNDTPNSSARHSRHSSECLRWSWHTKHRIQFHGNMSKTVGSKVMNSILLVGMFAHVHKSISWLRLNAKHRGEQERTAQRIRKPMATVGLQVFTRIARLTILGGAVRSGPAVGSKPESRRTG